MPTERRRHRRIKLRIPVAVTIGGVANQNGFMLDLSSGGLAVMIETEAHRGWRAHFSFEVDTAPADPTETPVDRPRVFCETTGHIVRVMAFPGGSNIGVEFGFCNDGFADFVEALDAHDDELRQQLLGRIQRATITLAER